MAQISTTQQALKQLGLGLFLLGLILGILLSYSILIGDAQGRVNLLLLLLLFAFLPVIALLFSLLFLLRKGGKGLAGWLLELPFWPRHLTVALLDPRLQSGRKLWFIYQTQLFTLGFSLGCLLLYLLLLLGTDISFIWRSTLLNAGDLLPVLNAIALPWQFWPEAQASLQLIEQTRDFRLEPLYTAEPYVGTWWKYILAAQLTYNFLPRAAMLLIARHLYRKHLRSDKLAQIPPAPTVQPAHRVEHELAQSVESVQMPYYLLDWAGTPESCRQRVETFLGKAAAFSKADPILRTAEVDDLTSDQSLLVLVKSWEPPMGELADFLLGLDSVPEKLIMPLDWNEQELVPVSAIHLDEWRRFAATLPGWKIVHSRELI